MSILDAWAYSLGSFLIMTDLEPDDMLALYMLSKSISNSKVLFLVGEGNSNIKEMRMKKYIELLGFKNATVLRGMSSDKNFKYDGFDVETEKEIKDITKVDDDIKFVEAQLDVFISDTNPAIICLKPPRELIKMYFDDDNNFSERLAKCEMAGYMSFNLRCLMKKWEKPKIIEFLKNFKRCYFYETHNAVGSANTITTDDLDFNLIPKIVKDVMKLWNKFMMEDCKDTIKKLRKKLDLKMVMNDSKRYKRKLMRNEKKLTQIEGKEETQFVNADTGLIMSLLQVNAPYKLVSIKYDEKTGYPVMSKGDDLYCIQPNDRSVFRKMQVLQMKKFLIENFIESNLVRLLMKNGIKFLQVESDNEYGLNFFGNRVSNKIIKKADPNNYILVEWITNKLKYLGRYTIRDFRVEYRNNINYIDVCVYIDK